MNTHPYTPALETLSRMVSEAAMELPPLTHPEDGTFLRIALAKVVEAFWENYIMLLPEDAQNRYMELLEGDDVEGMTQWYRTHANFKEDPTAERHGAKVLEDMALQLPRVMKEEYAAFTSDHHA